MESHVIRVDDDVHQMTVHLKGLLIVATGRNISMSDALKFLLTMKGVVV